MPYSISRGQTTVMSWKVTKAIRVEFLGEGGTPLKISPTLFTGEIVLSPTASTTYVLNAYSSDGTLTSSRANLEIDTPLYPPRIEEWSAANANLNWGDSTILTWRVSSDAVKVEMNDPRFGIWPLSGTSGTIQVTPNSTSNYVLTAYSKEGISASESLTLNVIERVP